MLQATQNKVISKGLGCFGNRPAHTASIPEPCTTRSAVLLPKPSVTAVLWPSCCRMSNTSQGYQIYFNSSRRYTGCSARWLQHCPKWTLYSIEAQEILSGGTTAKKDLMREQLGSDPGTPQSKALGGNHWRTALLSCHDIPLFLNLEAVSEGLVPEVCLPFH